MGQSPQLDQIMSLLDRLTITLIRPVVLRQLLAFALIVLLAWALAHLTGRLVRRWQRRRPAPAEATPGLADRLLRLVRAVEYTLFPLVALGLGQITIVIFDAQGWRTGLLERLAPIFWLTLGYQLLIGVLSLVMAEEKLQSYRRRFLLPIFVLLLVASLFSSLAATLPFGEMELFALQGQVITLRSLSLAVLVLYLFLSAAWIVRDLVKQLLVVRVEPRNLGPANAVIMVTYYGIVGAGVLTAFSVLGFDLSTLAIIFGGLSVGIGFGLQELVANFISGMLLVFDQSLRPGDIIEVGNQRGVVNELRIRATILRTIDNVDIFVPNKTLLTSTVSTYPRVDHQVRRVIDVGVSYDSDPTQVRDALLQVAGSHGLVLKDPAPQVYFSNFGPSSLDFQLAVWIDDPSRGLATVSDLRFMIWKEFARAGIQIPFPQHDIHIRSGLPPSGAAALPVNRADPALVST